MEIIKLIIRELPEVLPPNIKLVTTEEWAEATKSVTEKLS